MFLKPFMDPLPIPIILQPKSFIDGCPYYEVSMMEFQQCLHSQLNKTTVWGYEGTYPGPTFEVTQNQQIYVCWKNLLPVHHLLPVDKTVHGAKLGHPEVRTVVHVHGASVPPHSLDDLLEHLRQKDIFSIADEQFAVLESSGELSVQLKPEKRQVIRQDLMITAPIQTMPVELIMDGQVIRQNFTQKHLTEEWMNELTRRGISDISEVTYACLGTDQKLYIDTKKDTNTGLGQWSPNKHP